jgi:hypothetical protein
MMPTTKQNPTGTGIETRSVQNTRLLYRYVRTYARTIGLGPDGWMMLQRRDLRVSQGAKACGRKFTVWWCLQKIVATQLTCDATK